MDLNKLFDIKGYEGAYSITKDGQIFSWKNCKDGIPKEIKQSKKNNGYWQVKLYKNNIRKYYITHRLVAMTFIENPNNKREVNHIDGDKDNNKYSNLEWVTSSENQKHAFRLGLQKISKGADSKCSIKINQLTKDGLFVKKWDSINEVKRELGFNSFWIISCCKKRKKYNTAYKFKWEYAN